MAAPKSPPTKHGTRSGTARNEKRAHDGDEQRKTKRKATDDIGASPTNKTQRRSGRGGNSKASTPQLLNFLLSKEAEDLTRPDDESEDIEKRGKIKTYSSAVMNPFEELLCAVVLSRPISHRLGLRTIRTILNDPYNFNSAKAVKDAGSDKQHQALWDARTQHKDKTAQSLGRIADVVLEKFSDSEDSAGTKLSSVLKDSDDDVNKARDLLKSSIKGLGPTGLDIFFRRVQWLWQPVFPFVDGRTADSLRKFDLPYDAETLEHTINKHWIELNTKHLAGDSDSQKKRRAFVVLLERVIGADLEGKVESVMSQASK